MYRSTGFLSFFLRRLTGIALVIYLLMHMWVIGGINGGAATFNDRMEFLARATFKAII